MVNGNLPYQVGVSSKFITDAVSYGNTMTYGQLGMPIGNNVSDAGGSVGQIAGGFSSGLASMPGSFSDLQNSQTTGANPILAVATMGSAMVNAACGIFIAIAVIAIVVAALLALIWTFTFTSSIAPMIIPLMGLFTPALLALITAGLVMSLYIPLIPFIIFTFGAIGWFINVIEAMIAAPLVALGIAHPEGQEILGKAEPAVILLVNVFLRPTLMIFGLLAGMMLSYVGIWMLNAGFGNAWTFASASATGFAALLGMIGVMLIYALIVLQVVQKSFSLIYVIPDEVLKWIGGNIRGLGGEAEAEGTIAGGAHTGAKTVGETGQAAGAVGEGSIESATETAGTKKENAASDAKLKGGGGMDGG